MSFLSLRFLNSGVRARDCWLTFPRHHVNASPIFVTINAQDWIPIETKARLLEWKIRMDLLQYAARGVPELEVDKLKGYKPRKPELGGSLEGN